MALRINGTQHNRTIHSVVMLIVDNLSVIMLSVVMLSIVMLSFFSLRVAMLSVVKLNAIMLSVVAPTSCQSDKTLFPVSGMFKQNKLECLSAASIFNKSDVWLPAKILLKVD
jgi:hypothetical protein